MRLRPFAVLLSTGAAAAVLAAPSAAAPKVKTMATGMKVPWGVTSLPGGDALVSERDSGRIVRISRSGRSKRTVARVPGVSGGGGEGGLLGIAVSPTYSKDGLVYAYYTTSSDNRIARFKLGSSPRPIVTGLRRAAIHNGGRIAFGPDGKLYAGVGDAGETGLAQQAGSRNGKILRMNPDGSAPSDNPTKGSLVYSLGHRNPQGLAWDRSGRLWAAEFGQDRFDELNLIRAGGNYGWPAREGASSGGGFVSPKVTWRTSESSPSGLAIVGRTAYLGALQGGAVLRAALNGTSASKRSSLLKGRGRIRTVQRGPGNTLWVTTSNRDGRGSPKSGDDRVLRVSGL